MKHHPSRRAARRLRGGWWLTPAIVLALGVAALAVILLLEQRADSGKNAQLTLAHVENAVNALQDAPFQAATATGGSPVQARSLIARNRRIINASLGQLRQGSPAPALAAVDVPLGRDNAIVDSIYAIGVAQNQYGVVADRLAGEGAHQAAVIQVALAAATKQYDVRARRAERQATDGTVGVVALLLLGFGFAFRRSAKERETAEGLAAENATLFAASRKDSLTDALTQLPNRRALFADLDEAIPTASLDHPLVLAIFDLDGFKQYNDTFGHPAGDALLVRLAGRLHAATTGVGRAYRLGGDEFCVFASVDEADATLLLARVGRALAERGDAFSITASHGSAAIPREESGGNEALDLADQRLYENKTGRSSASRQTTDVLLTVLSERSTTLHSHLHDVARLARVTAERFGLPAHETRRIELAATLHDVGKAAIPETILNKPTALTGPELELIRRHTEIGERIVRAAPALAQTADLIRSSHERVDGTGYPDGLAGDAIPLGASIIAVCDAYDAMVSDRPYRAAKSPSETIAELRRCAGTQFRSDVVDAFVAVLAEFQAPSFADVA